MCSRPRAEPQELHMHANTKTAAKASARSRPGSVLTLWRPEDRQFWEREGEAIARINLWISVPALFLAFAIWQVWSVVAVNLPALGFTYSTNQLFWLAAAPALSGATLRIFYSFMVPLMGGRRWTALSTASLLIPAIGIGYAVQDASTGYPTMLILALLCGLGGGNFSSSMANISFFFPKEKKGLATGLNAGIGNLGVSLVQFVVPVVITMGVFGVAGGEPQVINANGTQQNLWLQNAGFIWVIPIALASIAAWFGMNDIADARASFADQAVIFKRKHNWLMCWLYVGTFGSFIGFSAGFAIPGTAGRIADASRGRLDLRQAGRRPGHALHLRGHDRRGGGRHGVLAGRRPPGRLQRVPRHVHRAVRADRPGQRLDVPHDPRDLPA